MEVDDQIVGAAPKFSQENSHFPKRPRDLSPPELVEPAFAAGDDDPVQVGMVREQIGGRLLDDPGDIRVGIETPQGGQRRQGVDDVADGAQFDDQDVHVFRSFKIQRDRREEISGDVRGDVPRRRVLVGTSRTADMPTIRGGSSP